MNCLPDRPNLERLRREARALQRGARTGDPASLGRMRAVLSDPTDAAITLAKAQAVVARNYGFPSWPKLKAEADRRVAAPTSATDAEVLAERWFALADAGALPALSRALAVGKRRIEAARAVMRRQPDRYRRFRHALVRGLGARQDRTRFECAHALDTFGDISTRYALVPLMEDSVPRVRWMAMHALSCHACGEKPDALEADIRARIVEAAERDPSPHVRRHAAGALAAAGDASAVPALRAMLARERDPKVLRGIGWALRELTRPDNAAPAGL